MGFKGWLKTWGTVLVAVLALFLSGIAILLDNIHYQEITKPHTQHEEIYNRLSRLDGKIDRIEGWINADEELGLDRSQSRESLIKAKALREQSETQWDHAKYAEADTLISQAYEILSGVLPPAPIAGWVWLIVGLVIVAVIGVAVWLVLKRQTEGGHE
ncbi:hypothetical protein ACFLUU_01130 [Chloroflexota bacterium]